MTAALIFAQSAAADQRQYLFSGEPEEVSAQIISRYVRATENSECCRFTGSVEIDIEASLPKLQKSGHLRALKKISRVGRSTYHVLSFQGDNTVKKEVIARYLQVDQTAHPHREFAVIPANYKFKFRGERSTDLGGQVYVFQISPRKKRMGLFKGELWLDAQTYLPVYEAGRLVKNPTIFFKKVDFERAYTIRGGVAVPEHTTSIIEARMVGRVELSVEYSNFSPAPLGEIESDGSPAMAEASQ